MAKKKLTLSIFIRSEMFATQNQTKNMEINNFTMMAMAATAVSGKIFYGKIFL